MKDPLLWTKISFIALKRRILHRSEVKTLAQCALCSAHAASEKKILQYSGEKCPTILTSKEKILHSTGVKWYEQSRAERFKVIAGKFWSRMDCLAQPRRL